MCRRIDDDDDDGADAAAGYSVAAAEAQKIPRSLRARVRSFVPSTLAARRESVRTPRLESCARLCVWPMIMRAHTHIRHRVCVGCVHVSAGPGGRARRPIESNMAGCYIFYFFFGGRYARFKLRAHNSQSSDCGHFKWPPLIIGWLVFFGLFIVRLGHQHTGR